jgi:hypothetical protein
MGPLQAGYPRQWTIIKIKLLHKNANEKRKKCGG